MTTRLAILGDLKSPKTVREWLLLSQPDLARELARYAPPFSQSMISLWESGKRAMPPQIVRAYGEVIAARLSDLLGRRIEIAIDVNSPWRVSAYGQCACGEFFKMHSAQSRRCPRCRGKQK